MREDEFDFDIVSNGYYYDTVWGYDEEGEPAPKRYRIDTATLRVSPEVLNAWFASCATRYINDFDEPAEFERYAKEKEKAQKDWKAAVCEMMRWKPEQVCITHHTSEIFCASWIREVKEPKEAKRKWER